MTTGPKVPAALLALAAELRAGGASWAAIGKAVNRLPKTVQQWSVRYPELWAAYQQAAARQLAVDAAAEGLHVLRRQLRSDDDKTSRDAAGKLLDFKLAADKLAPPAEAKPRSRHHRLADHLETLSDDQLQRLLDDSVRHWLDHHPGHDGPVGAGGGDRPGPVPLDLPADPARPPADAGPGASGAASVPEPAPAGGDRAAA